MSCLGTDGRNFSGTVYEFAQNAMGKLVFFFSALVLGTLAARYSPGDFVEGAMPLSFDRGPPLLKLMVILPQIISSLVHL